MVLSRRRSDPASKDTSSPKARDILPQPATKTIFFEHSRQRVQQRQGVSKDEKKQQDRVAQPPLQAGAETLNIQQNQVKSAF
ncbi:MAG: hypothetical protein CSA20_01200 [Deltaproteobacteria bacterium]|nr:MAG: hypothetical protein CSB32_00115 [Desulfobacterales bacterium]PIE73807.1 MAG: hypothetical protein CSA20_01200 [Deltaproteobacteria bacterium]